MDRVKAVIYPYDIESTYFFRYNKLNKKYDVVGAVAPKGWGIDGKDVLNIDDGGNIGIRISNSFDELYDKFDTIILIDSNTELDFDDIIYKKIEIAVNHKKNLVCFRKIEDKNKEKLINLCKNNNVNFEMYFSDKVIYDELENKALLDINVPIIFVMGVAERTKKFDIELNMYKQFVDSGYNVQAIGTKNHCEIFGFKSFPNFMTNNNISECSKIVMFNRFVKSIEIKEKPDVIIIGIPGGVMPIGNVLTNNFGITAYLISNAVKPDAVIFSMLYAKYKIDTFYQIDTLVKYKFGYNIDCFNISNIYFDYQESEEMKEKCYTIIDSNYIEEKKDTIKCKKPIFNILNQLDAKNMCDFIIESLAGEENVI